ncbi:MAG: ATP-binding protein [Oscillospiraceae bacterium]|nr:ATP-binding protein [Oscillospiraceae bacterium]
MSLSKRFSSNKGKPFSGYDEYMSFVFAAVDLRMRIYLEDMMGVFASEKGGYKNVLYPDLEIAHGLCQKHLSDFSFAGESRESPGEDPQSESEDIFTEDLDDDMADIFAEFVKENQSTLNIDSGSELSVESMFGYIKLRAEATGEDVNMPFYHLCRKLDFSNFTVFCFACAILSSTQTNYSSVFQVVNQNGQLSAPSFESAARIFYGNKFSITGAYGEMSKTLEQLQPLFDLKVNPAMPFSTVISPDKRLIDFLFGKNPSAIDENFRRFFSLLTDKSSTEKLDPFIANKEELDALNISYDDGTRVFALFGDEGSGRKFTIKHFCKEKGISCISIDGNKLFAYDFSFVDKALWSVSRECLLLEACCCLDNLSYREEEKEKFFGYMDLAFNKLTAKEVTVFTASREKLPMREMTTLEYTALELPTPNNNERVELWKHYSVGYDLDDDVELLEMSTKFLFTAGKIKSALRMSKSLSAMKKLTQIARSCLFEACYNQMSHELTQKATKIKATYSWDDIVMSPDQRQSLEYACDQMRFRKQVYEDWDYNRKYPYGRGLSVLLFGAPGTGKSMCAQVLANALNLELYRVDLSKVVDKYVGETEKSISMIFREAKKCNVVLFFDECDTLFAKRSDDGGSGQASANNKTALLLQEVEAYDGVSVLATNYKHNIDPAFFRRMKFIVEFQFPDPDTREILWKATIPKNTPLAEDVDVRFLAERFEFVGGNIKNCILNAAFLAAGDPEAEGKVHMKHYLLAIRYEFVKTGKVFTRSDFEPYASLIL